MDQIDRPKNVEAKLTVTPKYREQNNVFTIYIYIYIHMQTHKILKDFYLTKPVRHI